LTPWLAVAGGRRIRVSPFLDVHHENYSVYFNYLGRSQNPKHPYLDGAVSGFELRGRS
jgi:hypothetical protein